MSMFIDEILIKCDYCDDTEKFSPSRQIKELDHIAGLAKEIEMLGWCLLEDGSGEQQFCSEECRDLYEASNE